MIAKRVGRNKAKSDFTRLSRYVLDVKGRGDPASWERTADYILDLEGGGEKVGWARVTNCISDEPGFAVKEVLATQAMNTRAKGDKSYHLVISFPPGEKPTREQLIDCEDTLADAIGLGDHQRLSAVHVDTDHFHVHVAINKIHPQTFLMVEPYFDKQRLMVACEKLELKHGFIRTNHGARAKEAVNERAADMQAHAGKESLLHWIKENAAADLEAVRAGGASWQELHQALARYGLEIKPRGAGLVIGTGRVYVKASAVGREFAMKALTDRWGAFVPPTGQAPAPEKQYSHPQGPQQPGSQALYAEYQAQRASAQAARIAAQEQLREAHAKYVHQLHAYYAEKRHLVMENKMRRWNDKRITCKELANQREADLIAHKERAQQQRAALKEQYRVPNWQSFLEDQAERGNAEAAAILDRKTRRQVPQEAGQEAEAAQAAPAPREAAPTAGTPSPALRAYVAARNELRQRVASIEPHAIWAPSDAGEAVYQGKRRLTDGTEAVLLQRGGVVTVKPVTEAQAAKAARWTVGQTVTVDDRGRFIEPKTRGLKR